MSRIETEFPFPNLLLGSFGISSINESVKDLAKARHSAGKEAIRLIKRNFVLEITVRCRTR